MFLGENRFLLYDRKRAIDSENDALLLFLSFLCVSEGDSK